MLSKRTNEDLTYLSEKLSIGDQTMVVYTVLKNSVDIPAWLKELGDTANDIDRYATKTVRTEYSDGHGLAELFQRGRALDT